MPLVKESEIALVDEIDDYLRGFWERTEEVRFARYRRVRISVFNRVPAFTEVVL